jgi:hypothetical protein
MGVSGLDLSDFSAERPVNFPTIILYKSIIEIARRSTMNAKASAPRSLGNWRRLVSGVSMSQPSLRSSDHAFLLLDPLTDAYRNKHKWTRLGPIAETSIHSGPTMKNKYVYVR